MSNDDIEPIPLPSDRFLVDAIEWVTQETERVYGPWPSPFSYPSDRPSGRISMEGQSVELNISPESPDGKRLMQSINHRHLIGVVNGHLRSRLSLETDETPQALIDRIQSAYHLELIDLPQLMLLLHHLECRKMISF